MNRSSTILIVLLLSLILGVYSVWPKYKDLKLKSGDVARKEAELRSLKTRGSEINLLYEELGRYSAEMEKIDAALPSDFSLFAFLNYLQKISSENGLILKNNGYSAAAPQKGGGEEIKELHFDMNLSGPYSSFLNFLSVLERSSKLIEIENISFSAPKKDEPWDFNLKIKVYSY